MTLVDIEQNDVDISKLFEFTSEFEIELSEGNLKIYQKLLGDEDYSKVRVRALRASADVRTKVKEGTHEIFVLPEISKMTKDEIVDNLVSLEIPNLSRKAQSSLNIKYPVAPKGDLSLEDQEKHQKEIDDYLDKSSKKLQELLLEKAEEYSKTLGKNNKDKLKEMLERSLIDNFAQEEFNKVFKEMSAFFGSYKDPNYKKQLETDFDKFRNYHPVFKQKLMENYAKLEVDGLSLKK